MKQIPKKINVAGIDWIIKQDKKEYGSSFTFKNHTIILGANYKKVDDVIEALIHEISEIIHLTLNTRYTDTANDSYFFIMNHAQFQTHNDILINTLIKNKIIMI